ncbi:hypothetical protein NEOLEDRAFT_1122617, partial [Neolentinus lepideus HHB14362 ss-1]
MDKDFIGGLFCSYHQLYHYTTMSCAVSVTSSPSSSIPVSGVRKRTSSFSTPKPTKVARTSTRPLRRTISFAVLSDICPDDALYTDEVPSKQTSTTAHTPDCSSLVPYNRTLRFYKEQRERRRGLTRTFSDHNLALHSGTSALPSNAMPSRIPVPKSYVPAPSPAQHRSSSPLSPHSTGPAPRISIRRPQRGKREPDLYRVAILTRMRCSPEGQKILMMGPRLAVSILSATRELERIVERDQDGD